MPTWTCFAPFSPFTLRGPTSKSPRILDCQESIANVCSKPDQANIYPIFKTRTTRHVDTFTKQGRVVHEREFGRIEHALGGQPNRTDVQLDLVELEEVTWGRREEELLRKGDDVCEVEVVDLGSQHFL